MYAASFVKDLCGATFSARPQITIDGESGCRCNMGGCPSSFDRIGVPRLSFLSHLQLRTHAPSVHPAQDPEEFVPRERGMAPAPPLLLLPPPYPASRSLPSFTSTMPRPRTGPLHSPSHPYPSGPPSGPPVSSSSACTTRAEACHLRACLPSSRTRSPPWDRGTAVCTGTTKAWVAAQHISGGGAIDGGASGSLFSWIFGRGVQMDMDTIAA